MASGVLWRCWLATRNVDVEHVRLTIQAAMRGCCARAARAQQDNGRSWREIKCTQTESEGPAD